MIVCSLIVLIFPPFFLGVLSEEQIQLKKLKKQEDDQARTIILRQNPPSPPSPPPKMTPDQLDMIEKLVAAQQQCNQRSFSDRLKVTVLAQYRLALKKGDDKPTFLHITFL